MNVQESEKIYSSPWVCTQHGRFDLDNPTFDIRDIAHALSLLCRFNGHISRFYSVASHSLMVSWIMEDLGLGDPHEGLLHDGTEAYLSDVPSPFKQRLPDWKAIDLRLEQKLRLHFGLSVMKSQGLKQADWLALFMEAHEFLPGRGAEIEDPFGMRERAIDLLPRYLQHYERDTRLDFPHDVRRDFIDRHKKLLRRKAA